MGGKSSDLYAALELPRTCSSSEIRNAYKRLAMIWHPDKYTGCDREGAKLRFQQIREAYEVLSDDGKRFLYDAGCQDELRDESSGSYGMGDFLNEMTSMMNQMRQEENDSMEDLRTTFMSMFSSSSPQTYSCSDSLHTFTSASSETSFFQLFQAQQPTVGFPNNSGVTVELTSSPSSPQPVLEAELLNASFMSGLQETQMSSFMSGSSRKPARNKVSRKQRNTSRRKCNRIGSLNSIDTNFPNVNMLV